MENKQTVNSVVSFKEFIDLINRKITDDVKATFCYTAIVTFFTHIIFFVNRFANEDDIHLIKGIKNMIGSGRWMNAQIFSGPYILPIVLFVITIISISISSVLINSMFKIKNRIYIFFISAILVTFPILALGFGYSFMIERYVLGILTSIIAVHITDKYEKGFFIGSIFLAISLGYYQSYITVTISLSMFLIIIKGLTDIKTKKYLEYALKFLMMGILGIILYFILVKINCYLTNTPLLPYKGIDSMGSFPPISKMPYLLIRTYYHVIGFFFGLVFLKSFSLGLLAQLILFLINFVLLVMAIIKSKLYKNKLKMIIIILLIILLPSGLNIVDFMAYNTNISSLNIYQFVFVLISPFILLNIIEQTDKEKKLFPIYEWIVCIAGIILIWNNFIITNTYYLKINYYYNYTVQLTNRIYSRIEQVEGFNDDTVVLIGNVDGVYKDLRVDSKFNEIFMFDQGLWDPFIGYYGLPNTTDYKFHLLTQNILGIQLKSATLEDFEKVYSLDEYKNMKSWPHKDSIKFINDILVVKIS